MCCRWQLNLCIDFSICRHAVHWVDNCLTIVYNWLTIVYNCLTNDLELFNKWFGAKTITFGALLVLPNVIFGTKYLVPKYLVPCIWYQVLGTMYLAPGTWDQVFGTKYVRYMVPSIWYQGLDTKDLVPCICVWGLSTKYFVPSTWYKVLGTKYLVPCICSQVLDTKYLVPGILANTLAEPRCPWPEQQWSCLHMSKY